MRETELVCVNCPKGCHVSVTLDENKVVGVKGYSCEQGLIYAKQEVIRPVRVLTSTVKLDGGTDSVIPVITDGEIPLDIWREAMAEIRKISVKAPVNINDIIIKDFMGTGVDLIASRTMKKIS